MAGSSKMVNPCLEIPPPELLPRTLRTPDYARTFIVPATDENIEALKKRYGMPEELAQEIKNITSPRTGDE